MTLLFFIWSYGIIIVYTTYFGFLFISFHISYLDKRFYGSFDEAFLEKHTLVVKGITLGFGFGQLKSYAWQFREN